MSVDFTTHLIYQYRYWVLIPLSLLEGPIIAFIAGTLASVGFFNMYFLSALFFVRDVGLDAVYYAIGYFGGHSNFAKRMLAKLRITSDHLDEVRRVWTKRPGITMLVGKLSYGIASAFIVLAGTVKMPLKIFFKYGIIVAVLQYGSLLFLGYFLGTSFSGEAEYILSNVQYLIAILAVVITGYYLFSWYMRGRLLKDSKQIEDTPV